MKDLIKAEVYGRLALVPADVLPKIRRKERLLAEVRPLLDDCNLPRPGCEAQALKLMSKIVRMRIPACVQFLA